MQDWAFSAKYSLYSEKVTKDRSILSIEQSHNLCVQFTR